MSTDQIYKSYVQPHIDYCNAIWGGTSQRNLDRIYRLQKRACQEILDYQYENIATSMEELKSLNIYERIFLKKAKLIFRISLNLSIVSLSKRVLNDFALMLRYEIDISFERTLLPYFRFILIVYCLSTVLIPLSS